MAKLSDFKKYEKSLLNRKTRRVQDLIPIQRINKNGIFEIAKGKFSKVYTFNDINYALSSEDEQETILKRWCKFLNAFSISFQISINNKNRNMDTLRQEVLLSDKRDDFDQYRHIYNKVIEEKIQEGKQGIVQEKYITITVEKKKYEEALAYFNTFENTINKAMTDIGSALLPLNAKERLRIYYDVYQYGNEQRYAYDFDSEKNMAKDCRDYIAPAVFRVLEDYMQIDDKFFRALYVKSYPSALSDSFFMELTDLPIHMMTSLYVTPMPKSVLMRTLKSKYIGVESEIVKQQRQRSKNGDFLVEPSYNLQTDKEEIKELMDDVRKNDQSMFYTGFYILLIAETLKELDDGTESVVTTGQSNDCQIKSLHAEQWEGLSSVLPYGISYLDKQLPLETMSLAALVPFNVQELQDEDGVYYGINQISKNLIVGNRRRLFNGNGFTFGVSGSGKSFMNKCEIVSVFLETKDDIIIVDPMNEYFPMSNGLKGETIDISSATNTFVNPLDFVCVDGKIEDAIKVKSDFMLSICEQCIKGEMEAKKKSIIDRVVTKLYREAFKKHETESLEPDQMPTMKDFYRALIQQKEQEAKDLALELELYIEGSLDVFTHHTNVNVDNRFLIYGIQNLSENLRPIGMLIMLENIRNRIIKNAVKGRRTWLWIDEIYTLFGKEYTEEYLQTLWRQVRKLGGFCHGIIQNGISILNNEKAATMLANSEFVVILKQDKADREALAQALNISSEQLKYVTNSPKGTGLIKFGSAVIPFDNTFDKDNALYRMISTNPNEKQEIPT